MRLNFGRRLVLFVHWLLSLAGCALAVTMIVWPKCLETALALLEREGLTLKIYAIAVLAVYLIFAVGAVCIILGGKKRKEKNAFIIVDSSETGRTRIAVSAVDQMIRQAVRGVDGIAEMKSTIINNDDSITIAADVAIRNGAHVPTVTANIRRSIRGYIEQNCGVTVRGVSVSVHSLADEDAGRRGRKKKTEVASNSNPTPVGDAPVSYVKPEPVRSEPEPVPEPLPRAARFDAPETISTNFPKAEPVSEPAAPAFDLPDEDAPIALTLDPELAPEPEAQDAPAEEIGGASEEESAESAPAGQDAPATSEEAAPAEAAPVQKKGLFGKLFGKRGSTPEPAPSPEGNAESGEEPSDPD